jgi:hypothetical protein
MSVFDVYANPEVTTKDTTATTSPDYYTNLMSGLSTAGIQAMANPNQVAPLTAMQTKGYEAVPTAANAYKPGLSAAEQTASTAAAGAAPQISAFMNPYTTNVVDEMARLQQQNVQRNLMPQLKAGFVGSGALGSQRYANAMGQTMSDLQSNLTGQQYGALSAGYKSAVDQAIQNAQLQTQAGQLQGNLAEKEQSLGLTGAGALTKAGAEQQAYQQSLIDAPLKTATNASALLRGYQAPSTVTNTKIGPLSSAYYQASPLSQTLGAGALIGSGMGTTKTVDPRTGVVTETPNWLSRIWDRAGSWLESNSTGTGGYGNTGGSNQTGGQAGGSTGYNPRIIADGHGGYVDTTTGLPVNADGTPIDQSGDEDTTGGYYDEDGNFVENP